MPAPKSVVCRNWTLDVLRAFAILLVLFAHFSHMNLSGSQEGQIACISALVGWGWVGVPVFFTLSGYLIGGLLLSELQRTGTIRVGRFWIRRGWKIYPLFYLVVVFQILYLWSTGAGLDVERILRELFFLQNYGKGGLLTVSWSLAVEEHFYFLLPLLLIGMVRWWRLQDVPEVDWSRRLRIPLTWMALFLVSVCLWMRISAFHSPDFAENNHMKSYATHLRIDALFVGVALRMWIVEGGTVVKMVRRFWGAGLALAIAMMLLGLVDGGVLGKEFSFTYYLVMLSFSSSILIAISATVSLRRTGFGDLLSFVGRNSYAIYLIHLPVYKVMCLINVGTGFRVHGLVFAGLSMLAGITAGVFLTSWVEEPCLRLRDRWFPAR
jgi:peptidoglycan/LPS O-acetylase OafA/YrhL